MTTTSTSRPRQAATAPRWKSAVSRSCWRRPRAHIALSAVRPRGTWTEVFNTPLTAHILGGCSIGDSPETGVIDPWQRVYGHPGLHVMDGAAVTANLGVNPSLTITAQAERAMSFWPNKGETDPRPPVGAAYEPVSPVAPKRPAVPAEAPAALVW